MKTCRRCGTCCRNGGPALHKEDRSLADNVLIPAGALVTIRQGELAFYPMADHPKPVQKEFLKIIGHKADWSCRFFDQTSCSCSIHTKRPFACKTLKCWDTKGSLALTGKNLLTRFDFFKDNEPLIDLVHQHEKEIPCAEVVTLTNQLLGSTEQQKVLRLLTDLVNHDLTLRNHASRQHNLSLSLELFYFGRPLFQILSPFGISTSESATGMSLYYSEI